MASVAGSSRLLSPIDCARFGLRVGKGTVDTAADAQALLRAAREDGIEMLIVRTGTENVATVHALESGGMRLMEGIVYYRRALGQAAEGGSTSVRTAALADADAVEAVAREAFRDYPSHYRLDTRLPRAASDGIYPDWARRSVTHQPAVASQVLVAEADGNVAGFAALKFTAELADGMLYAVAPRWQGRGLYRELLVASIRAAQAAGCGTMEYSTQLTNTVAQHVIARLGFALHHSVYTFHGWLD